VGRLDSMNTDAARPGLNADPLSTGPVTSPLLKTRRVGGYGVAIAVMPYLAIKILWTFGLFLPTEQMGESSWRTINAATVVLAVVAIMLAMAFCMPWGERLPAWLVVLPVWVGTGLIVPMVLLAPVLGPAAMVRDNAAGAAGIWVYEQTLIMVSLVGVGIGLPLCLAGYVKARWPEALGGRTHCTEPAGNTRQLQVTLAGLAAGGCVLLAVTKVYWATGGTLGIDPTLLAKRDVWWHLLSFSTGAWALAGAWGVLMLAIRRGSRRFLPPMAAAWTSSGVLFAQNLYSSLSATRADAQPSPEYSVARVLTVEAGIVLGVMMGMTILLVLHDRRRALGSQP